MCSTISLSLFLIRFLSLVFAVLLDIGTILGTTRSLVLLYSVRISLRVLGDKISEYVINGPSGCEI